MSDTYTINYNWKNVDNSNFYEFLPLDLLPNFAIKGGLDTGCDLDMIWPLIESAKCILELGSGYGRVINNLINKGYFGKIIGVERSKQFIRLLEQKFANQIELIECDINAIKLAERVDLILWMWSGLCDFAKDEQLPILTKIISLLNEGGTLVIDTMPSNAHPLNADSSVAQQAFIPSGNGYQLSVYTPSADEMNVYAQKLGLKCVQQVPYVTTTQRNRILYLLN